MRSKGALSTFSPRLKGKYRWPKMHKHGSLSSFRPPPPDPRSRPFLGDTWLPLAPPPPPPPAWRNGGRRKRLRRERRAKNRRLGPRLGGISWRTARATSARARWLANSRRIARYKMRPRRGGTGRGGGGRGGVCDLVPHRATADTIPFFFNDLCHRGEKIMCSEISIGVTGS